MNVVQKFMGDSNMNTIWTGRECKGYWGSSFVNKEAGAWRGWVTWPRTHSWSVSGLVFQTSRVSSCSFSNWNLMLLCFLSLLTDHSEKVKERTQVGGGLSWFASSTPTTLGGNQLWDELCVNVSYPGTSWNSFLCGFIMNPTTMCSSSWTSSVGPGFSLTQKQSKGWSWK